MKTSVDRRPSLRTRPARRAIVLLILLASIAVVSIAAAGSGSASTKSSPPANVTRPAISGKTLSGQTLTLSVGTWTNSPTSYAYQWYRCDTGGGNCAAISGATASHYTLTAADVGHTIRTIVTAKNAAGSANAESAQTAVVLAPPVNVTRPAISGKAFVGQKLTVSVGTWTNSPTSYAYQWYRCDTAGDHCAAIAGASASHYTVAAADVGHTVVTVVAAKNGAGSANAESAPTAIVQGPPANTKLPSISGRLLDGQTLSLDRGAWTNNPIAYAYLWLRCDTAGAHCGPISGANSSRYTLTSADIGHTMRVQVTATNAVGSASAQSIQTAVVEAVATAPTNQAKPTLSGSPQLGSTLNVSAGKWAGTQPIAISEQWQRCDSHGNNCADLSGATGTSYNIAQGDIGNTLRVKEIARNVKGSNAITSNPTAVVTPAKGGAISVTLVNPPERLIVDRVKFTPSPLRSRRRLVARFHVVDTRGFAVQGALVYALGLPYGWVRNAPEVPTDASGWATIILRPTAALPLRRGQALVIFVRARKPGDNLLAGVSTRRLVQAALT